MKNSTLKVLAGVVAASMSAMALYSVVCASDEVIGDAGIMTIGQSTSAGTSDPQPTETDPTETDPTETKPAETDPAETDPTETKPAETDPTETKPAETEPAVTTTDAPSTQAPANNAKPGVAGGNVSASPETKPASTAQAAASVASVKSGETVSITMGKNTSIPAKTVTAFANKKDASITLNYSGVGITLNSDDVDAKVVKSLDFKTNARFLSGAEKKAFAGAKEVRQLSLKSKSMNGIDKVTVTFKMRGGSKNMDAKLLLRTASGKYILVAEGKVGADRNVDFEISEPGNYIVYTGEADIEYEEAE